MEVDGIQLIIAFVDNLWYADLDFRDGYVLSKLHRDLVL